MKNKKGFTLVELIGVVIIIGLLVTVTSTTIIGQIRNNKEKLQNASIEMLKTSALSYLDDYNHLYKKSDGNVYYLTVGQLINKGYLKDDFTETYEDFLTENSVVTVTVKKGGYSLNLDTTYYNNLGIIANTISPTGKYTYMGGTYYKGSLSSNYVYFSGYLWRIMGVNADGSIRMIMDEPVTITSYGPTSFSTSFANDWLNNYFASRLSYSDLLYEEKWCDKTTNSTTTKTELCTDLNDASLPVAKVGLLSIPEYNLSLDGSNSYLKLSYISNSASITPKDGSNIYSIATSVSTISTSNLMYLRPIINVEPSAVITTGSGTSTNPYLLVKPLTLPDTTVNKIGDITSSIGEYVKINTYVGTYVYRIIGKDNSEIKLSADFVPGTIAWGSSSSVFSQNVGIGEYLNNSHYYSKYYPLNLVRTELWYQGDANGGNVSHKLSTLSKTNMIYSVSVGLPKISDILTSPIHGSASSGYNYWSLSKKNSTTIWMFYNSGASGVTTSSSSYYYRPVIIIDSNVEVTSGIGTKANPYVL